MCTRRFDARNESDALQWKSVTLSSDVVITIGDEFSGFGASRVNRGGIRMESRLYLMAKLHSVVA